MSVPWIPLLSSAGTLFAELVKIFGPPTEEQLAAARAACGVLPSPGPEEEALAYLRQLAPGETAQVALRLVAAARVAGLQLDDLSAAWQRLDGSGGST